MPGSSPIRAELPPKSFHGWTVRTLLHKKATSVPGWEPGIIDWLRGSYTVSKSIDNSNQLCKNTYTHFYVDSGGPGWSRRRYLPIKYCIATFLYTLKIISNLVVYTCSFIESRVESRVRSPYYLSFVIPEVIVGRRSAISLYRLVTPLLPSTILLFVSPILLFSCPLSSLLYCSLGPSTEGPTTLLSARHLLIHTFMSNALTSQYSIGSPENILRNPHAHLVSGTSSPP